ncbi:MAG: hypothetical protein JW934_22905 [Anaerolineae bacterium]|nr:hypothetical protein [Anaerolineae bacterium]
MNQSRSKLTPYLIFALLLSAGLSSVACSAPVEAQAPPSQMAPATIPTDVQVALSAAQTTTSWDSRLAQPEPFELPLLFLNRQRQATAEAERTLTIQLAGLAGGRPVEIDLLSLHENPTTNAQHRQSRRVELPDRLCSTLNPCTIAWALDAATMLSDLYRLVLRDDKGNLLWENPNPERPDLVALDAWQVDIDGYALQVTYGVLLPFARGPKQDDERLAPDAVHAFIADQFLPIAIHTWRLQFGEWGFGPIHPDWDADGLVEVFFTCPPFALFDGSGTYTVSTYTDGTP